jgi:hypothetical protein
VLADPAYIVMSLAFIGNDVFVGGSFLNGAAISEADHVIRFDGSAWHALGSDGAGDGALDELGYAWEMAVMGDELVLAGSFQNVGSAEADRVIAWDGDSWKSLGSSAPGVAAIGAPANALAVAPAAIYAGGGFIDAGGEPTADAVAAYSLASPQPDGRIRKGKGALVGNDIYNITGDGQSREGKAPRGNTITFTISVQNDGGDADAFLVQAVGSTTTMYSVRYFRGTTEITSSLSPGSSYTTPTIAPGGKLAITVKVKVKSTATLGSNVLRVVNVHSLANSSILDSVMFTGMRK